MRRRVERQDLARRHPRQVNVGDRALRQVAPRQDQRIDAGRPAHHCAGCDTGGGPDGTCPALYFETLLHHARRSVARVRRAEERQVALRQLVAGRGRIALVRQVRRIDVELVVDLGDDALVKAADQRMDAAQLAGVGLAEIRRYSRAGRELLAVRLVDVEPAAEKAFLLARAVRDVDQVGRVRLVLHVSCGRHPVAGEERDRDQVRPLDAQQPDHVGAAGRPAAVDR